MRAQGFLWSDRRGRERARARHWEGFAGNVAVGSAGTGIRLWDHRRSRADGVLSGSCWCVRDSRQRTRNLYGSIEVVKSTPSMRELARVVSAGKKSKTAVRPPGPK